MRQGTAVTDFFISYTGVDRSWAEWIAWQLEATGYTTVIQAWDFRPGANFAVAMQHAAAESERTIAVLSPAYLRSGFTAPEWAAAFARDPTGTQGLLVPVRIQDCEPKGLLPQVVYVDLVGLDAEAARDTLLAGVQRQRAKPTREPEYPGHSSRSVTAPPRFPGAIPRHIPFLGTNHFGGLAATDEQFRRYRREMLEKVRLIWIKGFLEPSLDHLARIELGLETRPDAVARPFDLLVQRPQQAPQSLPTDIPISRIFDEAGKALLILGAPGAGKSTLLFELTRDLLDRAVQDENHLIPVVFNLSSWAAQQVTLADWLIDELNKRYDIPRKLAQTWVDTGLILPLLDGLDEVAADRRAACVEAINAFLNKNGLLPMVVCSRVADYEALTVRLRLPSAVIIQALSRQYVQSYVDQAGMSLAGLHTILQDDETLWELLNTPLMLSVAAIAYKGRLADEIHSFSTVEEHRTQLFAAYTDEMFKRRAKAAPYSREQTERWLAWLARTMKAQNQSNFYLEWMQLDWLPEQRQQRLVTFITSIISGLSCGLLSGLGLGLLSELTPSRGPGFGGLIGGTLTGMVVLGAVRYSQEIKPVEKLRWSWPKRSFAQSKTLLGVLVPTLLGFYLLPGEWFQRLLGGLGGGLFFWLTPVLLEGFTVAEIGTQSLPNEGIKRSIRNALIGALGYGLFTGPSALLAELSQAGNNALDLGLSMGLLFGLIGGLHFGGRTCLYHFALRLVLWHKNFAPLNYIRFLDYATARIFLRKVGGGYIFVHRMLLEYFAVKPQADVPADTPPARHG
jgi:hypothetical protein